MSHPGNPGNDPFHAKIGETIKRRPSGQDTSSSFNRRRQNGTLQKGFEQRLYKTKKQKKRKREKRRPLLQVQSASPQWASIGAPHWIATKYLAFSSGNDCARAVFALRDPNFGQSEVYSFIRIRTQLQHHLSRLSSFNFQRPYQVKVVWHGTLIQFLSINPCRQYELAVQYEVALLSTPCPRRPRRCRRVTWSGYEKQRAPTCH
jgi:hypothetical protein